MFAPILFAAASFVMKSKFVKAEDMDFVTGLDEVIADTYDEPPPKNIWEKFWLWIVSVIVIPSPFESIALLIRVYSSRRPRARSVQWQPIGLSYFLCTQCCNA